jgi:hypothetical protein
MKTAKQEKCKGAVLVVALISMIAAALVGAALLTISTGSRLERVRYSMNNRAYYLAESGAAYVRAQRDLDASSLPSETYTLANGDQFVVHTWTNTEGHVLIQSVGIANPGTSLEARRQVHFDLTERGLLEKKVDEMEEQFVLFDGSEDKPEYKSEMWDESGFSKVEVKDTGPSQGIALVPKVDKDDMYGRLALSWQDNPKLIDSSYMMDYYSARDNLLSYDMQVKLAYFPTVPSTHLMMGLSFRLHADTEETYGLSFFRSDAGTSDDDLEKDAPWVLKLDAPFRALRDTNFHVALWYRAGAEAAIQLINSKLVPSPFLYPFSGGYELSYYNTLLLQLREEYTDAAKTARVNKVVAYLASTVTSPLWPDYNSTNAVWQECTNCFPVSTSAPLQWSGNPISPATGNTMTNIDARVTSEHFETNRNAEFGVHLFYDRNSNNENFFRDLAIRFDMEGAAYGGSQIQW